MRRTPRPAPNCAQRGYALVLVMVGLVTLTILGVTTIQGAQLDMKITQNMRHHKQLQYGALAGQDQARGLLDDVAFDAEQAFMDAEANAGQGGCIDGWIDPSGAVYGTSETLMANNMLLADYSVDLCRGVCGTPTPGNDLNSAAKNYSFSLDVVSVGTLTGATSMAQMGGMLIGVTQGDCQ